MFKTKNLIINFYLFYQKKKKKKILKRFEIIFVQLLLTIKSL
jgi:hypothetical protein